MRQVIITATVLMLSGCAVVPLSKPTPVPPERIYYTQPAMEANPAKVVFTRDKRPPGGGGGYHQHIYLDGKRIASVRPGERLELNIPSGHHQFGIKPTDPFGQYKLYIINEKLEGGKDYLYRIVADSNDKESRIERTEPSAERLDDED